jgi:hypothetical protein
MFEGIIRRAQQSVDQVLAKLAGRAAVAVPFLVAFGFATAAAAIWLVREFGAVTGNLIMAVAFAILGSIAAAVVARSQAPSEPSPAEVRAEAEAREAAAAGEPEDAFDYNALLSDSAQKLALAAGPALVPLVFRFVARNLPLLISLVLAMFFLTRAKTEPVAAAAPVPPAPAPAE